MDNNGAKESSRLADAQWRRENREMLEAWWDRLMLQSVTWDLEAVKHLVVLNAAGFAGMATLNMTT